MAQHTIVVKDFWRGVEWKIFFVIVGILLFFLLLGLGTFGLSSLGISPITSIIVLCLIVILIIFRKRIFKKERRDNNIFSLNNFIIYGITFSIGYWFSTILLPFIKTSNLIVVYLIVGLCLELSAKVCQMFLYNKYRVIMDKWFVLWVLIHSAVIYGILYLIRKIAIQNQYLLFLTVGFSVAIITYLIWMTIYKR